MEQQERPHTTKRLALACGECGAAMKREDSTDTHHIYRCQGPYRHEYYQSKLALRFRFTGRNTQPPDAA